MLISKKAIRRWINRPLANSDRAKRLTPKQVRRLVRRMNPAPIFPTTPRHYQWLTLLLIWKYPGYFINYDMGLGKTFVSICAFVWRRMAGQCERMLVLVPQTSNVSEWEEDCNKHFPELGCVGLHDTMGRAERQRILDSDAPVVVATYMGLQTFACHMEKEKGSKKQVRVVDKALIRKLSKQFGMLVCDESTFLCNVKALTYKVVRALLKRIVYRLLLTGVPFGHDPQALWPQMKLVDGGATLGSTLGLFRTVFCEEKVHGFTGWPVYSFDESKAKLLRRFLKHRSIRYESDDVLKDLPPLQRIRRRLPIDPEARAYHERIVKEMSGSGGNFTASESAWHRMRQLASGWIGYKDPEGDKHAIRFKHNPKLEAMIADLKLVPPGRKSIIFNMYTMTGQIIEDRLKSEGIKAVRLYGETRNKRKVLQQFKNDKSARVLILQVAAGAYGLNLQVANYVFVMETSSDPKARKQMEKRAHRGGQTRTVFLYDYVMQNSIEKKIYRGLDKGYNLFDRVMSGKAKLK